MLTGKCSWDKIIAKYAPVAQGIEHSPPKVALQRSPLKKRRLELSPITTGAVKKIKYVAIAQLDRAHAS